MKNFYYFEIFSINASHLSNAFISAEWLFKGYFFSNGGQPHGGRRLKTGKSEMGERGSCAF
ncbi:MAG: hypothetical protein WHS88_02890 [Anaerohalosphaeraceae bacterium]